MKNFVVFLSHQFMFSKTHYKHEIYSDESPLMPMENVFQIQNQLQNNKYVYINITEDKPD